MVCLTEYPVRKEDGPFRMLSCASCRASAGVALECSDCHYRWHGRTDSDVCRRCLENRLAQSGIYPGKGWKDPI